MPPLGICFLTFFLWTRAPRLKLRLDALRDIRRLRMAFAPLFAGSVTPLSRCARYENCEWAYYPLK